MNDYLQYETVIFPTGPAATRVSNEVPASVIDNILVQGNAS